MRIFSIILAAVAVAVVLSATSGCASQAAAPAQMPEPIAYDKADYTPPSDFDMNVDTTGSTFESPAVKIAPTTAAAPRLVSLEKTTAAAQ